MLKVTAAVQLAAAHRAEQRQALVELAQVMATAEQEQIKAEKVLETGQGLRI